MVLLEGFCIPGITWEVAIHLSQGWLACEQCTYVAQAKLAGAACRITRPLSPGGSLLVRQGVINRPYKGEISVFINGPPQRREVYTVRDVPKAKGLRVLA